MKQLVSILIPAYNAEKWICESVKSAIAQTWPWKEIIVVDDGSRDSTLERAQRYAAKNVHILTQANKGASSARNRALTVAQGDYIQWLDADDLLSPDKISRQMECAEPGCLSRTLLSGPWGRFFFHKECFRYDRHALWDDLDPTEWLYRKLSGNLWMATMSWLISRRLTDMSGPWNENLSLDDDGEYFCRIIGNSDGIRFIEHAWCFRRVTQGLSSTVSLNNKKLDSQAYSLFSQVGALQKMEDSPRTRAACIQLFNRWSKFFYPERPDIVKKMQVFAAEFGMSLAPPELSSKYRFLKRLFGWRFAKRAQFTLPIFRLYLLKTREYFQYLLSIIRKNPK